MVALRNEKKSGKKWILAGQDGSKKRCSYHRQWTLQVKLFKNNLLWIAIHSEVKVMSWNKIKWLKKKKARYQCLRRADHAEMFSIIQITNIPLASTDTFLGVRGKKIYTDMTGIPVT